MEAQFLKKPVTYSTSRFREGFFKTLFWIFCGPLPCEIDSFEAGRWSNRVTWILRADRGMRSWMRFLSIEMPKTDAGEGEGKRGLEMIWRYFAVSIMNVLLGGNVGHSDVYYLVFNVYSGYVNNSNCFNLRKHRFASAWKFCFWMKILVLDRSSAFVLQLGDCT